VARTVPDGRGVRGLPGARHRLSPSVARARFTNTRSMAADSGRTR
jgi:hypothetical protein